MPRITLPRAGKNVESGTIRRWLKRVGDAVGQGETVVEVETEEGLLQVESGIGGILRELLVSEGKTVPVDTAIAVIGGAAPATGQQAKVDLSAQAKPQQGNKPMGKVTPILMPKAGQSMEEGTLVKWHVKPGDLIAKGQVIFEIETDKATMEVEAIDEGKVAVLVLDEGGTLPVLQPVAYLAENAADVEAFIAAQPPGTGQPSVSNEQPVAASDASAVAPAPAAVSEGGRVKASPAARRIASERGVDISTIGMGSGPGGRIVSTDVPLKATPVPARTAAVAAPAVAPPQGAVRKRMSKMRKAIAANLLLSKQTIPHFYIRATINADPLYSFYQGEKAKYPCSLNDVVVMACAKAISEFPAFRSRLDGDEMIEVPTANVGVAVGMDDGLVVPVLVAAEQMTLKQIGSETKRIAGNARGGKIEAMGQGVFTITNMGMFGVEEFSAIINPPEAAILAVGAMREQVIVSGGTLRAGRVMTMTLSADHRIIDGMLAAKFMARLKELLEWPAQLVG